MKTTVLKREGKRLHYSELHALAARIEEIMRNNGFYTQVTATLVGGLNLSVNRSCFEVIPERLGYNAKVYKGAYGAKFSKGYKRTRVPLWEQRVRFNHLLNDALDAAGVSCSIKSGGTFVVRTIKGGRVNSWSLPYPQIEDCDVNGVGQVLAERMTEAEAIERIEKQQLKCGAV